MPISTSGISVPSLGQNLDPSIYANQNIPKGMTLGELVNLQRSNIALQKEKALLGSEIQAGQAQAQTAQAQANTAQLENMYKQQGQSSRDLIKLLNSQTPVTPEIIQDHVVKTMTNAGATPQAINAAVNDLPTSGTDKELRAFIARHATNSLTAEAQLEKLFPNAQFVSTGQEIKPVAGGSPYLSYGQPGQQVGPGIQQQLPPTTPVVNPQTGAGGYYGVQGQGGPQATIGPGQAAALTGGANITNQDYQKVFDEGKEAANRIPIFQNIRKLAPEAFTGVGAERKALVSGLAQAIGMPVYEMQKVATDELSKNTALLALAGGNTDAARQLAEIANPNKKLNEESIKRISNQMIGMERLKQARAQYLGKYQNDPSLYTQKANEFNAFADYRIFQEMTKADVDKMKASMSKTEIDEMSKKINQAKLLGIIGNK